MRRGLPALLLLTCGAANAAAPMNYLFTHGEAANPIMRLGWGLIGLSIFVILFIAFSVLIGIWWKRSRGPREDNGWPVVSEGRQGGEMWLWIGVPITVVLLLGSAIWTFVVLARVAEPPGNPTITLDVTAHRWWWQVRYVEKGQPDRTFETANEIHIPVGQPVKVRLTTADVLHSFWVPQLAGKTDVIAGQTNTAWLETNRVGVYDGRCAEFCGLQHAHMAFQVIAQSPNQFHAWWNHQLQGAAAPVSATVAQGEHVFESHCSICHTVRGLPGNHGTLGPDLTHVMSRREIAAGMLPNTIGNLAAWITNAQAIKPGTEMPTEDLKTQQLHALLAYMQTLK